MRFVLAFFFLSVIHNLKAQKFTYGLHLSYINYRIMGTDNTSTIEGLPYWEKINDIKAGGLNVNGTFGYNPIFYKFSDNLCLGGSFNVGAGYLLTPKLESLNGRFVLDLPQYLAIRYGKSATKQSTKNMGYGLGLGYDYTFNTLPFQGMSIMAEVNFGKATIRLNTNVLKYTYYYYYTSEGSKPAISIRPIGIQLLFKY